MARGPRWQLERRWAGWLVVTVIAVGVVLWWPLAGAASIGWMVFAIRGYGRSARAMAYLAHAFPATKRAGPVHRDELHGEIGDEPFEMPFVVRNGGTMHVIIATPLPTGITIDRRRVLGIGDPEFDAEFGVVAHDADCELWWRMMFSAELRARWCALFHRRRVELRAGWLDIAIDDHVADGPEIERLVRESYALAVELFARLNVDGDALQVFVDQIPREPVANVRLAHYEWLVTGDHEVPALLRLASQDRDAAIRSWATRQRPSATPYR